MHSQNLSTARDDDATSAIEEVADAATSHGMRTLSGEELQAVAGGYPCSYLGIHDWGQMMSYYSRQYSC